MKTYRIWASHCGDPSEIDEEFESEDDAKAIEKLEAKKKKPCYQWDVLWMERIDVKEETTRL